MLLVALAAPAPAEELAFTYRKIVDRTTAIPGSTELMTSFGFAPSIDGGTVGFTAVGASGTRGIFTMTGRQLSTVADNVNVLPGFPQPLGNFSDPYVDDGSVAFYASEGIYSNAPGPVTLIMDSTTGVALPSRWPRLSEGGRR